MPIDHVAALGAATDITDFHKQWGTILEAGNKVHDNADMPMAEKVDRVTRAAAAAVPILRGVAGAVAGADVSVFQPLLALASRLSTPIAELIAHAVSILAGVANAPSEAAARLRMTYMQHVADGTVPLDSATGDPEELVRLRAMKAELDPLMIALRGRSKVDRDALIARFAAEASSTSGLPAVPADTAEKARLAAIIDDVVGALDVLTIDEFVAGSGRRDPGHTESRTEIVLNPDQLHRRDTFVEIMRLNNRLRRVLTPLLPPATRP